VHITFLVTRKVGTLSPGQEPEEEANTIKGIRMVPIGELQECGFADTFCRLAHEGFPDRRGAYRGNITNIGL